MFGGRRWLRFAGSTLLAAIFLVVSYFYFANPVTARPIESRPAAAEILGDAWQPDVPATDAPSHEFKGDNALSSHVADIATENPLSTASQQTSTTSTSSSIASNLNTPEPNHTPLLAPVAGDHVIDTLVAEADEIFRRLFSEQTLDLRAAATNYQRRRGRLPPPSFDKWLNYAAQRDCVVIEQFFDPLYESLDLLWTVRAQELKSFASKWPFVISIRNGTTHRWEEEFKVIMDPMSVWEDALNRLPLEDIPDVDLAFNTFDEPMAYVNWDFRQRAKRLPKHVPEDLAQVISEYETLPPLQAEHKKNPQVFAWDELSSDVSLWEVAREACDPMTHGSNASVPTDYSTTAEFPDPSTLPYMRKGFINDWTSSKSACINPVFRNLHGTFVDSQRNGWVWGTEWALTTHPIPLLGSCRIHDITAEVPIPGTLMMDPPGDEFGGSEAVLKLPWTEKRGQFYWRGVASGGINKAETWTRFQRHRLVSMLNGTQVGQTLAAVENNALPPAHAPGGDPSLPFNFPIPSTATDSAYDIAAMHGASPASTFRDWLLGLCDAALTHLRCFPPEQWFGFGNTNQDCEYSGPFYNASETVPFDEMFLYKYSVDVDGASWSSRFRSQLASSSLVLKATIYDEWHDSRLVPWKHFVPTDVTNIDLYALLQYFLGFGDTVRGHDQMGKYLADEGSQWARKVLRRDDMDVYLYRLVLEMARLNDERRDMMGFVMPSKPIAL